VHNKSRISAFDARPSLARQRIRGAITIRFSSSRSLSHKGSKRFGIEGSGSMLLLSRRFPCCYDNPFVAL
jgi:hypothetical protein